MATNKLNQKDLLSDDIDIDLDQYDGLDNMNFDLEADMGGRSPASKAKAFLMSTLQGAAKGATAQIKAAVAQALPNTSLLLNDISKASDSILALKKNFATEVKETTRSLKVVTRKLLPTAKGIIPDSMMNSLNNLTAVSDVPSTPNVATKTEKEQNEIQSGLKSIFESNNNSGTQLKTLITQNQLNDTTNKVLDNVRHKESTSILNTMRVSLTQLSAFSLTTFTAYIKKDLELKYQHLFVAKDTFNALRVVSEMLEVKLEEIKKNTGLPDVRKVKLIDAASHAMHKSLFDMIKSTGSGLDKLVDKLLIQTVKKGLSSAVDMLEMGKIAVDTANGAGGIGKVASEMAVEEGGGLLGKLAASSAATPLLKLLKPLTGTLDDTTANYKTRGLAYMSKKKTEWQYDGGIKEWVASMFPSFDPTTRVDNKLISDPNGVTNFDNMTRTSIVEVIPGLLSKQLQQLTNIATGKTDSPELVYNPVNRTFITSDKYINTISEQVFGKESKTKEVDISVGSIIQSSEIKNNKKITDNQLIKDLRRLVANLAYDINEIEVDEFKDYLVNKDNYVSTYMKSALSSIKDQNKLLVVKTIISAATYHNGDINTDNLRVINDNIDRQMINDNYRNTLSTVLDTFGGRRFIPDLVNDRGVVDKDKLLDISLANNDKNINDYINYGKSKSTREFTNKANQRVNRENLKDNLKNKINNMFSHSSKDAEKITAKFTEFVNSNGGIDALTDKEIKDFAEANNIKDINIEGTRKVTRKNTAAARYSDKIEAFTKKNRTSNLNNNVSKNTYNDVAANNDNSETESSNKKVNTKIKDSLPSDIKLNTITPNEIKDIITPPIHQSTNTIMGGIQKAVETINNNNKVQDKSSAENSTQETVDTIVTGIQKAVESVTEGVKQTVESVTGGVNQTVGSVTEGIHNSTTTLAQGGGQVKKSIVTEGIQQTIGSITNGIQKSKESITEGIQQTIGSITNGIQQAKESITGGVEKTVTSVVGGADTIANKYNDTINKKKSDTVTTADKTSADKSTQVTPDYSSLISNMTDELSNLSINANMDKTNNILKTIKEDTANIAEISIDSDVPTLIKTMNSDISELLITTNTDMNEKFDKLINKIVPSIRTATESSDDISKLKTRLADIVTKYHEVSNNYNELSSELEDLKNKPQADYTPPSVPGYTNNNDIKEEVQQEVKKEKSGLVDMYTRIYTSLLNNTGLVAGKGLDLASMASGKILDMAKKAGPGVLELLKGTQSLYGKAIDGVGSVIGGGLSGIGNAIGGIGSIFKGGGKSKNKFIDVYNLEELEPGDPLLTKKEQIAGVIFKDGSKVTSSYEIDQPVLDPETGDTLITYDDISKTLCDITGKSLNSGGSKEKGGILSMMGSIIGGGLKLGGSTADLYKNILMMGGKGVGAVWNKLFGSKEKKGDDIYITKMDSIISILKNIDTNTTRKKKTVGDTNNDNIAENTYADQMKEKEDALKSGAAKRNANKRRNRRSILDATGRKKKSKNSSKEDNEDSGGFWSTVTDWGGKALGTTMGLSAIGAGKDAYKAGEGISTLARTKNMVKAVGGVVKDHTYGRVKTVAKAGYELAKESRTSQYLANTRLGQGAINLGKGALNVTKSIGSGIGNMVKGGFEVVKGLFGAAGRGIGSVSSSIAETSSAMWGGTKKWMVKKLNSVGRHLSKLLYKVIPKKTLTKWTTKLLEIPFIRNLIAKGAPGLSKFGAKLTKLNPYLGVILGVGFGIAEAKENRMSKTEGAIFGALTGGAATGSVLSSLFGIRKDSGNDQMLGIVGAAMIGAINASGFGGALFGAILGATAEVTKISSSLIKDITEANWNSHELTQNVDIAESKIDNKRVKKLRKLGATDKEINDVTDATDTPRQRNETYLNLLDKYKSIKKLGLKKVTITKQLAKAAAITAIAATITATPSSKATIDKPTMDTKNISKVVLDKKEKTMELNYDGTVITFTLVKANTVEMKKLNKNILSIYNIFKYMTISPAVYRKGGYKVMSLNGLTKTAALELFKEIISIYYNGTTDSPIINNPDTYNGSRVANYNDIHNDIQQLLSNDTNNSGRYKYKRVLMAYNYIVYNIEYNNIIKKAIKQNTPQAIAPAAKVKKSVEGKTDTTADMLTGQRVGKLKSLGVKQHDLDFFKESQGDTAKQDKIFKDLRTIASKKKPATSKTDVVTIVKKPTAKATVSTGAETLTLKGVVGVMKLKLIKAKTKEMQWLNDYIVTLHAQFDYLLTGKTLYRKANDSYPYRLTWEDRIGLFNIFGNIANLYKDAFGEYYLNETKDTVEDRAESKADVTTYIANILNGRKWHGETFSSSDQSRYKYRDGRSVYRDLIKYLKFNNITVSTAKSKATTAKVITKSIAKVITTAKQNTPQAITRSILKPTNNRLLGKKNNTLPQINNKPFTITPSSKTTKQNIETKNNKTTDPQLAALDSINKNLIKLNESNDKVVAHTGILQNVDSNLQKNLEKPITAEVTVKQENTNTIVPITGESDKPTGKPKSPVITFTKQYNP